MGRVCKTHERIKKYPQQTIGIFQRERSLGKPRNRLNNNTEINFREIGCENVEWIQLAQNRVHWQDFINYMINTRVP
jgi:hypothetical protein